MTASISINPKRVLVTLLIVIVPVILINIVFQVMIYLSDNQDPSSLFYGASFLYLDHENNLPTWFANLLLILAAGLLMVIGRVERTWPWVVLGFLFLFLALDEIVSLHERLNRPLRQVMNASDSLQALWVLPALLFVGGLTALCWRFFRRLPSRTRKLFTLAALLFIGGALGAELISGTLASVDTPWTLGYGLVSVIEESLELCGVSVFIYALLQYLATNVGHLVWHIGQDPNP